MRLTLAERITDLAAHQHGVVTRSQLLTAGLTARAVELQLRSDRLIPLHRGVYLLGDLRGPLEPARAREMAAVLACGPGAVISHRSAAWLWDVLPRRDRDSPEPVDITIPGEVRRRRPGIRVRRCGDLGRTETTILDGIPVTTAGRTLRDLSTVLSARELNRAAARAERRNLVSDDELASLVARHRGRPGAPILRAAILANGGPTLTRSEAEERFLDLIRRGGLPTPQANVLTCGHEVDFLWADRGLAVEVDGFGFHASRRSFEQDRRRDAELAAAGIQVVRLTWAQIVRKPDETMVLLAQALARTDAGARIRSRATSRTGTRADPW